MFALITLSGPLLASVAFACDMPWLFWIGVGLAAINLFMDVASGATRVPVIEIAMMVIGAWLWSPWWMGTALGLLAATAVGGIGMIFARR